LPLIGCFWQILSIRDDRMMGRPGARISTWLDEQAAKRQWTWWPRWSAQISPLLGGLAACILLTFLFFLLADEIVADDRLKLDLKLSEWVRAHESPGLTQVMEVLTNLASAPVVIALWLLMVGWLVRQRRRRSAIIVAIAWPLGQGLVSVIKFIYQRPRPDPGPGEAPFSGYSFPSGHTFTAVVTYGLLAALISEQLPGRWRWAPWAVATLVVAGVGYSRVYLGAHYPVDVLGSLLLGGAWLSAILLAIAHDAPSAPREAQNSSSRSSVGSTE
jgi:membrane-associated phospholipid phosphatase